MKNILIALDYDPSAQKIAEIGFNISQSMNAQLTLMHVVANPQYYVSPGHDPIMGFVGYVDMSLASNKASNYLDEMSLLFLDKTSSHLGDDSIKKLVTKGSAASSILETAKKIDADMIIVGSHSKSWLEKILIGSVAEKVLHESTTPILIIPTKKR